MNEPDHSGLPKNTRFLFSHFSKASMHMGNEGFMHYGHMSMTNNMQFSIHEDGG